MKRIIFRDRSLTFTAFARTATAVFVNLPLVQKTLKMWEKVAIQSLFPWSLRMKVLASICVLSLVGGWLANHANADLIEVTNPGFEDTTGSVVFNEFTFGAPVGWQIYDPNGNVINNGVGPQFWVGTLRPTPPTNFNSVPEGQRVAIPFNFAATGGLGEYGFQQTLATTLAANHRYRLQVEIGNIASGFALNGQFFDLDGFPGYRIDLLAGGVVIASDHNSLAGLIPEAEWGTSLVEFQTGADHALLGQSLGIRLVNLNQIDPAFPGADLEVDFDHVRLSAVAIPEPSSLLIPGVALIILSNRRRRCPT